MDRWEYCEVDFDGKLAYAWPYDEAGDYINRPLVHARLGILLAQLGHDGWEIISTFWRSRDQVTYMLKRKYTGDWSSSNRAQAQEQYRANHPKDRRF